MEMTQIINKENNPVNSKNCGYNHENIKWITDMSAVGNGTKLDVKGKSFVVATISGTFDATVCFIGYYDNGSAGTSRSRLNAKNCITGEITSNIKAAGAYIIDVSNVAYIMARCDAYTSGAVSVDGIVYTKPIQQGTFPTEVIVVSSSNRNVMIGKAFNITVAAGATSSYVISNVDVGGYVFNYLVVRSDKQHPFIASLWYQPNPAGSIGYNQGVIDVISVNDFRGTSDWIEVKGNTISVQIKNDSSEDRKYDVYLYGVR